MPILTFNFDLWPPKSIEFIISPWLTCLRSLLKKPQWFSLYRVHKLISIHVNCDLDIWPPKSIGFILSPPWLTCLPIFMKKQTTVLSLSFSQAYFHICLLWLWPLTSYLKINRVHPFTMTNMNAKFDEEAHNGLLSILFTCLFPYLSILT